MTDSYEARGPHLPDVMRRISPWAYAFGLVSLLQVWRAWQLWLDLYLVPNVDGVPDLARLLVPAAMAPLLGVALFIWHPESSRTMQPLVLGLVLMTAGELLGAFDAPIRELVRGNASFLEAETPGELALQVLTGLTTVFGLFYLAAGLAAARAAPRSPLQRPITVWLAALAVIGTVASLLPLSQLTSGDWPAPVLVAVAIATIVSFLATAAWMYLASVAIGGWLSRDLPRSGWTMAALGIALLFGSRLAGTGLFIVGDAVAPTISTAVVSSSVAGWTTLLLAFCLGLPTPPGSDIATGEPMVDPPAATPPGSEAG